MDGLFLGLGDAAGHDDFAGADGFTDVELAEHAHGGVDLVSVAMDHNDEGGFVQVDGFAAVVLDDLENLRALGGTGLNLDEDHLAGDRVVIRVFITVDDIDEFVALFDDLFEAFGLAADADGHA